MSEIFLSYRHAPVDSDLARRFAAYLTSQDQPHFFDGGIPFGAQWSDEIDRALRACRTLVLFVSADSANSLMVRREVVAAARLRKPILPLRIDYDDDLPYGLAAYVDPIQNLAWRRGQDPAPVFAQILAAHLSGAHQPNAHLWNPLDRHRLLLERLGPRQPWRRDRELEFLLARNRAVPVAGRGSDLASIRAWLDSPAETSVRIFTGPAGAGKTRLAIQVMEDLGNSDWDAGFLHPKDLKQAPEHHWDGPTLAVVDYAGSVAPDLKAWLDRLSRTRYDQKLRILLLERAADPRSGWLSRILDYSSTGERIRKLFPNETPDRAAPLEDRETRRSLLAAALHELGSNAAVPAPGADAQFDAQLNDPLWEDPLYLLMAAVIGRKPDQLFRALTLTKTDLALELADRELARLGKYGADGPPETADLLHRMAAVVTACRGLDEASLRAATRQESEEMGIVFPGGPRTAANRIAEAMLRDNRIAPIEPDIIGEAVLVKTFGGAEVKEGTAALLRAAQRDEQAHALDVCFSITRACQDFVTDTRHEPLEWVEDFIRAGATQDVTLLWALEREMPHDTLVLCERAVRIDELLLARLSRFADADAPENLRNEYARIANNLSVRLGELGCQKEALARALEAVRIGEDLARSNPAAFLPELAMSLNTLANKLGELDRPEEALARAEQALRIHEELALERPQDFLADLAGSLNNLAIRLRDLGRREDALVRALEAVKIREALVPPRPGDLATSLNNLANMLSILDRREEARFHAEQAVRIQENLAHSRADAFLPGLALYRNNLANILSSLGRHADAFAHAEQAVSIYDDLARVRPGAFLPDLARSLGTFTRILSDLGRREEALVSADRAVRIREDLARSGSGAFLPDLARSLRTMASILLDLGRSGAALARAEQAASIYEALAGARPDAFLPELARSLCGCGAIIAPDDPRRATEFFARAIRTLTQRFLQVPDAFAPQMRYACSNYLQTAQAAGIDPDIELLRPILSRLAEAAKAAGA